MSYFNLRPYQLEAIERVREMVREGKRRIVLCAPTGCHAKGQRLLMADGSEKAVEDVELGDHLLGPDGFPRVVKHLCRGRGQMVRIIPMATGWEPFVVNDEHLLTIVRDEDDAFFDVDVLSWVRARKHGTDSGVMKLAQVPFLYADSRALGVCHIHARTSFTTEPVGEDEYYGFVLDGDQRYLLDDRTITHNSGKTVMAGRLITNVIEKGRRAIFLAHRRELIRSPFCKLVRAGVDPEQIGIIMAGVGLPKGKSLPTGNLKEVTDGRLWYTSARRRPNASIQIASVGSLLHRDFPPADLVIPDEAHRSLAKSHRKIIEHYIDQGAIVIGPTATPERADGKGLDQIYEDIVVVASYMELVEEGFLVEPRVFTGKVLPDTSRVKIVAGDFNLEQLAEACNKQGLIGDIVSNYQQRAAGVPALGFAVDIEHSRECAARFCAAGIKAVHLDGDTPTTERDEAVAAFERGEIEVLWNCDLFSEGTDIPIVKCVILARPTNSVRIHLQQCGRGSRPCEKCDGCRQSPKRCERQFIILDHAGNVGRPRLGLPQENRPWSIEGRKRRQGGGGVPKPLVWICKHCQTCNPLTADACQDPGCGEERPAPEKKELQTHDGELVEVAMAKMSDADKRAAWFSVIREWTDKNATRACPLKPIWCEHRFRELYGSASPPGSRLPTWTPEERKRRDDFDALEQNRGKKVAWGWGSDRLKQTILEESGRFSPPVAVDGDGA